MLSRHPLLDAFSSVAGVAILAAALVGCTSVPAARQGSVAGARSTSPSAIPSSSGSASVTAQPGTSLAAGIPGASSSSAGTPATALYGTPTTGTPGAVSHGKGVPAPTSSPPMATRPPVPDSVANGLSDIYQNVQSFQGTVQLTAAPNQPDAIQMTVQQWFMQPDKMKLQIVQSQNYPKLAGSTLTYDSSTLTVYDAENNQLLRLQNSAQISLFLNLPQERLLPQLQLFQAQQLIQSVKPKASITENGTAKVSGRTTRVISVKPESTTPQLDHLQLWLDQQTGVPLMTEVYGDEGSLLLRMEYTNFDPEVSVDQGDVSFSAPSQAKILSPTLDNITAIAGFQDTTVQDVQPRAGFQLLQPAGLPAGVSLQSVKYADFGGNTVVGFFYGTSSSNVSAVLLEKPQNFALPPLHGGQMVPINGQAGTLYQTPDMVVVDWTHGDTVLALATTLSSGQAMQIAQSLN